MIHKKPLAVQWLFLSYKDFMKKLLRFRKPIILIADALVIPALIFCEWLSNQMLATNSTCAWTLLGGKCITCGGTHFVNTLLNGRLVEAFNHNQYLFILAIFFAISFVLLNLYWLFDLRFVKAALGKMYSIASLIIACVGVLAFLVLRNMPLWFRLFHMFRYLISIALEKL